jgi:hypothetical protein
MAHNGIEALVDLTIKTARRRASAADTAIGIIAALRWIHAVLDEQGPLFASQMDATVRDVLIAHNLGRNDMPQAVPLPEPGAEAAFAVAVLEDAAQTCAALNAHTPDNSALFAAICLFATRLIATLGGTPDIRRLYDRVWAAGVADPDGMPRESAISLH